MKHIFFVLLSTLVLCLPCMGQIPQLMSHQGFVADSTGTGITGTLPMTFRLFNDSTGGSAILTQSFPSVTLTKGVFSVNIDVSTLSFTGQYWLESEVNSQTLAPRTRLTSAPYSLRALIADTADFARVASSDVAWSLVGNTGTVDSANFIGTTDNVPLSFRVNNILSGRIEPNGTLSNTFFGYGSGANNTDEGGGGFGNAAFGFNAFNSNTDGNDNTAIGFEALTANTTGEANTAVGNEALQSNETGLRNTAIGLSALRDNTDGNFNTAMGMNALHSNTTGEYNTSAGYGSLLTNTIGTLNTTIGYRADVSSGALTNATAIGANAVVGASNSLVLGNNAKVGIGTSAPNEQLEITGNFRLPVSTTTTGIIMSGADRFIHNFGTDNFFAGANAGNLTMTGVGNTAIGVLALTANTTGVSNTAIGDSALYSSATGSTNTATGRGAMYSNISGSANTATGRNALRFNTTGSFNTAMGRNALISNTTGMNNTALGERSMATNTTGTDNTAVGNTALGFSNTTGSYNTAIGAAALDFNTSGNYNTATGYFALYTNTTGFSNTAVGDSALHYNTTGNTNTALGHTAGLNVTTGSNLTLIGNSAQPTSGSATNQITLGNSSVTSLRCAVTTITSLSDRRDKKNIQELSLGLDFIAKLKPRQFNWDKREWYANHVSDGSKMQKTPTAGFIAQELDEVQTTHNAEWLNLVLKDNPERLEATWGNLLPIMVKAIQELHEENKNLKSENAEMKATLSKIDELEAIIKSLATEKNSVESKAIGEVR